MKVHIKICGITRLGDALLAEKLGAASVGFVFYHKSPRYIVPEKVGDISEKLGPFIGRLGVFVDEEPSKVIEIFSAAHLTAVQLHGSESPAYIHELKLLRSAAESPEAQGIRVIKAFRIGQDFDCGEMAGYDVNAFLLDTFEKGSCYGGTGKTFDWNKALECKKYGRIILAGGLNPSNVLDAVTTVKPWAVDVSSGVEKNPGIKDPDKMIAFFDALAPQTPRSGA